MAAMRVTPGRDGYKILFSENTVIMNYKFSAAAAKYGTKENRIMRNIRHDFPGLSEVVVSGRQQTSAKANTRLTYENMETHIRAYSNADDLLEVFRTVQALSKSCASPYKYVRDWFLVQFPDYKKPVVFQNGQLAVAPWQHLRSLSISRKFPHKNIPPPPTGCVPVTSGWRGIFDFNKIFWYNIFRK